MCFIGGVFRLQAMVHYVNLYATGNNDGTTWANAYTDLQTAMIAASGGDSVFVATATYQPAIGISFSLPGSAKVFGGFIGTETSFNQRNLTNKATLLGNGASVVRNENNPAAGVWDGFIITGGDDFMCGGINNISSAATIRNCIISGNSASMGGGIHNYVYSSPTIINCVISGNKGSGLYNNVNCSPTVINCTFAGNSGGIFNRYGSASTVINCIVWDNPMGAHGNNIVSDGMSSATVTYSDVQDVTAGTGNISVDPQFVAPGIGAVPFSGGDYRLQPGSPVIDAGSNVANKLTTDLGGNPRIQSSAIEMGAFENTLVSKIVYVDSSITVSGDGSSWAKAYKTLSDALKSASVDFTTVDSILVAKGTYYPTGQQNAIDRDSSFLILRSGIKVYGGYAPGGSTLRDYVANPTILSGNIGNTNDPVDNCEHVLVVAGVGQSADSVVLDGLSFSDASGSSIVNSTKIYNGIAVLKTAGGGVNTTGNQSDHIAFRHCTFSNNIVHVSIGGGGMYNEASSPFVSNCVFSRNAVNGSGGGMFNAGASPTIDHCSFLDNNVRGSGGGVFNIDNSNPLISNSLFSRNSVKGTGGAGIFNSGSNGTIINCTFSANLTSNTTTNNTGGAGIYNLNCSPPITQCTFTENVSFGLGGGGIFNLNASPLITDCQFSGNEVINSSGCGGGLFSFAASAPVLTNCIFLSNYTGKGAALGINSATASLTNCTFSANYSTTAAAIYSYAATADIIIRNSIIWGNAVVRGNLDILTEASSFAVSISNSDIQSYAGGTDGNINRDPLFVNGPKAGNNEVEGDLSLQAGSPAINAGNNAFNSQSTDIAGNPRVFGSAIDMGAYELQQATVPVTLIGFSGVLKGGLASLAWKTGVETAFSRFALEKSVNGSAFSTLAVIAPKGSNSSYTYAQLQPEPRAYYRLKMTEANGKFGYSDVVTLQQRMPDKLTVYPNPASDYISVTLVQPGSCQIYDANGRLILNSSVAKGLNSINIGRLAPGIYFLQANGKKARFVKIK